MRKIVKFVVPVLVACMLITAAMPVMTNADYVEGTMEVTSVINSCKDGVTVETSWYVLDNLGVRANPKYYLDGVEFYTLQSGEFTLTNGPAPYEAECSASLNLGTLSEGMHTLEVWVLPATEIPWKRACGYTFTVPAPTHQYDEWHNEVPATCTTAGTIKYRDCLLCGKHFDSDGNVVADEDLDIPAAHQTGLWVPEVPSTCTVQGVKGYAVCQICHEYIDATGNIIGELRLPLAPHVYDKEIKGEPYVVESANCQHGTIYRKACICGTGSPNEEDFWEDGDPVDHYFYGKKTTEEYLKTPADCTHRAVYYYSCTSCDLKDETRTFEDGPLAHELVFTYSDDESEITITCKKCDISSSLKVTGNTAVYSGNPVTGSFTADDDFAELIGADELTLAYADNNGLMDGAPVNVGSYQVGVPFDYDGKGFAPFADIEIAADSINIKFGDETEFTFDETTHTPEYTVTNNAGEDLVEGKDYTVSKAWTDAEGNPAQSKAGYCAGEGTLTITGVGNYEGEDSVKYSVKKVPFTVEGIEEQYKYTGKGVIGTGDYQVYGVGDKELVEGQDYIVSIDGGKAENQNPGEHTIKFISQNLNYESVELTYTIVKSDSPQTGDTNNMMLYLILAAAATALVASGSIVLKKKSR